MLAADGVIVQYIVAVGARAHAERELAHGDGISWAVDIGRVGEGDLGRPRRSRWTDILGLVRVCPRSPMWCGCRTSPTLGPTGGARGTLTIDRELAREQPVCQAFMPGFRMALAVSAASVEAPPEASAAASVVPAEELPVPEDPQPAKRLAVITVPSRIARTFFNPFFMITSLYFL